MKFGKATIERPCAKFDIDEKKFIGVYCDLFFEKPTPDEYFYQKTITYSCEDHRFRMANDDLMEERSEIAKNEFVNKESVWADQVRL